MPEQLLLFKPYKRIFMLYDSEIPAQEKAKKAANMIANISGGEVYNVNLGSLVTRMTCPMMMQEN